MQPTAVRLQAREHHQPERVEVDQGQVPRERAPPQRGAGQQGRVEEDGWGPGQNPQGLLRRPDRGLQRHQKRPQIHAGVSAPPADTAQTQPRRDDTRPHRLQSENYHLLELDTQMHRFFLSKKGNKNSKFVNKK